MSWCSGWDFNDNRYFYSKSLSGPWTSGGNIATTNTHTYESQVGFAVTIRGSLTTSFLYMGDRWSVNNFAMSRIVFLPMNVSGTKLTLPWYDQWNLDYKTGVWAGGAKNFEKGKYKIIAKHSGKALGVNGSAVEQQVYTGKATQLWKIENLGASFFKISNVETGNVIDINGASRTPGAKALQYAFNDQYNQKFQIVDCGNGYHRLVSVNTLGKALQITNKSTADAADAEIGDFSYLDHQMWEITQVNEKINLTKSFTFRNASSKKMMSIDHDLNVVQETSNNSMNQVWQLEDLSNGYYSIKNIETSLHLDNGNVIENLDQVKVKSPDKNFSQQWQLIELDNNTFKIVNRMSGKVLDNLNGSSAELNPITQYTDYASSNINQQWEIENASLVTSVSDIEILKQISIFLNPTNNQLQIYSIDAEINSICIFDMLGRSVYKHSNINSHSSSINFSNMPKGIYSVFIEGKNFQMIKTIPVE